MIECNNIYVAGAKKGITEKCENEIEIEITEIVGIKCAMGERQQHDRTRTR